MKFKPHTEIVPNRNASQHCRKCGGVVKPVERRTTTGSSRVHSIEVFSDRQLATA